MNKDQERARGKVARIYSLLTPDIYSGPVPFDS